jgi:Ca2+/Na+ antiporter
MAQAAFSGQSGLIIGNVVGSNIANVLLILGLSAMATPLIVPRRLIRLEVPLMILVSFVMLLVALDGRVTRLEGLILFAGFLTRLLFMLREQRGAARASQNEVRRRKSWARLLNPRQSRRKPRRSGRKADFITSREGRAASTIALRPECVRRRFFEAARRRVIVTNLHNDCPRDMGLRKLASR